MKRQMNSETGYSNDVLRLIIHRQISCRTILTLCTIKKSLGVSDL